MPTEHGKIEADLQTTASRGTLTVGAGRGFIVEGKYSPLVITAAHCLPFFPPCMSFSGYDERTYKALLGPLGKEPTVWAECLFADPIGDIAVLGAPDGEEFFDEAKKYEALTETLTPLRIASPPDDSPAWLLSLDGEWFRCVVRHINDGPLWVFNAAQGIVGGMSGSPIVRADGSAMGVMCTAGGVADVHTEGGPNPRLVNNLPGWILRQLPLQSPARARRRGGR